MRTICEEDEVGLKKKIRSSSVFSNMNFCSIFMIFSSYKAQKWRIYPSSLYTNCSPTLILGPAMTTCPITVDHPLGADAGV